MQSNSDWITSFEAAELMGVSAGFIQARVREGYLNGEIRSNREAIGRSKLYVRRSDIEERMKRTPRYRWQSSSRANTNYVTRDMACEILNVSMSTLIKMVQAGELTAVTVKPVPAEERVHSHRVYFRRHEIELLANQSCPSDYSVQHLAYFAGLIDGEGSIGIGQNRQRKKTPSRGRISHTLHLSMGNTCFALIDWVVTTFGGKAVTFNRDDKKWSPCRYWSVQGEHAARLLRLVLPYLIAKREQALIAIEFRSHVQDYAASKHHQLTLEEQRWREDKRQQIMALNNRYLNASREA